MSGLLGSGAKWALSPPADISQSLSVKVEPVDRWEMRTVELSCCAPNILKGND